MFFPNKARYFSAFPIYYIQEVAPECYFGIKKVGENCTAFIIAPYCAQMCLPI